MPATWCVCRGLGRGRAGPCLAGRGLAAARTTGLPGLCGLPGGEGRGLTEGEIGSAC